MKDKKKILYIDKERKYRNRAKTAFNNGGYSCSVVKTGEDGLDLIEIEKPDLVILNYSLQDYTGEEFYTRFLSDPRFKNLRDIPFICLTENGNVERSKLYNMGISACLGKPFSPKELNEFVEDVMASHQVKMEEVRFWETIHEAKDFLERVVESSVDSIITTDRRGVITYCNRASEEILGYSFEELVGRRISQFLEKGPSELLRISALLRKLKKVQNYRTTLIRKNKKTIMMNISISLMKNGDGKIIGALGIGKSIFDDDFTEYDLNESDRFAAVIETSVAVNHAVNNPLVPILGNAQFLLQDERLQDEDIRKRLRVIVKNALRIRDITQKLANITHPVTKEYLKGTRMLDIDGST